MVWPLSQRGCWPSWREPLALFPWRPLSTCLTSPATLCPPTLTSLPSTNWLYFAGGDVCLTFSYVYLLKWHLFNSNYIIMYRILFFVSMLMPNNYSFLLWVVHGFVFKRSLIIEIFWDEYFISSSYLVSWKKSWKVILFQGYFSFSLLSPQEEWKARLGQYFVPGLWSLNQRDSSG